MKKDTKLKIRQSKKKKKKSTTELIPKKIELIEQTTGPENVRKIQYSQKDVGGYYRGN